jgi:hypothetical protein
MRPSSLVLVGLMLAVACSMAHAVDDACIGRCWNRYNAEIEDCVNKADMRGALQPAGHLGGVAAGAPAYTGPQVDVLQAIQKECYTNVGTSRVNACILACDNPFVDPAPNSCEDVCRFKFKPNTLGRLRCMYNC